MRFKSQLVHLLLMFFVGNILMASTGLSAPFNWIEHEKSHFAVTHEPALSGNPDASPEQPVGKKQIKHECHASHFFQAHVSSGLVTLPPVSAYIPSIAYLAPAPRDTADTLFRPPR